MTVTRRCKAELERTEAADPQSIDLGLSAKELDALGERFARARGRNSRVGSEICRASSDCTHELGSAGFDRSVQSHRASRQRGI
jgi:hypothetical protein